jgi:hypothetical protein
VARPTLLLTLIAVFATLTSCGGGHASKDTPEGHGATGAPSRPLTRAHALAFAHAVNLTAADLPGFKISTRPRNAHESGAEKRLEGQMLGCVGIPASRAGLAEAGSASFEREAPLSEQSVSSEVAVARTAASARLGLGAIDSEHTRTCLVRYFNLLFKGRRSHGATFGSVLVAQGTPPAPGTSGGFGWRITTSIVGHGVRIPFYVDLLGFVYGPAEVSLLSSGAPEPFPAAAEQALYLLLLRRAKAQGV